jgi:hypothetical protein
MRLRMLRADFVWSVNCTYAISLAYICRYYSSPGTRRVVRRVYGGFSCRPVSFHFLKNDAVGVPIFCPCMSIRESSRVLHIAAMLIIPSYLLVLLVVVLTLVPRKSSLSVSNRHSLFMKASASACLSVWGKPACCKNGTVHSPHPSLAAQLASLTPGKVNEV